LMVQVFGLYKGALGPLIGQGFVSATQFGIYATLMPYIQQDRTKRPSLTEVVKAGCLTGTVMFIFVTPMEGVKARLQVQYSERHTGVAPKYTGTVDCYKKVWREVPYTHAHAHIFAFTREREQSIDGDRDV